jgi:alpha-amylase
VAAHVHLSYDATRTNVVAEVLTSQRDNATTFSFLFDGVSQSSNTKKFDATSQSAPVKVSVVGSDGSRIDLDPIDFIWNAPAVHPLEESTGDYRSGQKGAIVEFFMWPHSEVEKECAMLAKMGYMGAKLYPAQEQVMSYETLSYRLQGRMGSRDQLRQAINTCRSLGGTLLTNSLHSQTKL